MASTSLHNKGSHLFAYNQCKSVQNWIGTPFVTPPLLLNIHFFLSMRSTKQSWDQNDMLIYVDVVQ
jgi:hypothetical protein